MEVHLKELSLDNILGIRRVYKIFKLLLIKFLLLISNNLNIKIKINIVLIKILLKKNMVLINKMLEILRKYVQLGDQVGLFQKIMAAIVLVQDLILNKELLKQ